jgi:hypothetical protein
VGARWVTVHALADLRLAPDEAPRLFDGVAEGEGVRTHQVASWVEIHPVQIPEFNIVHPDVIIRRFRVYNKKILLSS